MQPEELTRSRALTYGISSSALRWRTRLALALAVPAGLSAGYWLLYTTLGSVFTWLFLTLVCPSLLCFFASSRHLLVAGLYDLAMMACVLFTVVAVGAPLPPVFLILLASCAILSLCVAGGIGAAKQRAA